MIGDEVKKVNFELCINNPPSVRLLILPSEDY